MPWLLFAPYLLYLMLKYRSPTLFTAANPGIRSGGVVGESKSQSLGHLRAVDDAVAPFTVIDPVDADAAERVRAWRVQNAIDYPLVIKPDVGERGWGVTIAESDGDVDQYLAGACKPVIVQRFVRGIEYGIFYCRHPDEAQGRVVSIAEVRYPETGRRGMVSLPASLRCARRTFRGRKQLCTSALAERIEVLARAHPGFFLGRFDVIAKSQKALQSGSFHVIEINGVMAEAVHMYDPVIHLAERIRTLVWIWNRAFEIGAANRQKGAQPMGKRMLLGLLLTKFLTQSDITAGLRPRRYIRADRRI